MPTRVTPYDVMDIMDVSIDDVNIDTYIKLANLVIEQLDLADYLNEPILVEIEKWLAAHYIAESKDRQAITDESGPVKQRYSDPRGEALATTTYGRVVMQLDTTGLLIGQGRRVIKLISIPERKS